MRALATMALSDLRQRVRDKSVIIFAVLVPLALMSVLHLIMGQALGESAELRPVTVAASVPEGDQVAGGLVETLRAVGASGAFDVTVRDATAEEARTLTEDGTVQLGLVVPDGFGAAVSAGQGPQVTVIEGDSGGVETQVVLAILDGVVDRIAAGTQAAAAAAQVGVPPAELAAIGQQVASAQSRIALEEGQTSDEQLSFTGTLVAGQSGLFLLFTVGFGVLALVTERDQGTLARLRSMPIAPGLIVAAKGAVSFVLGIVATGILLTIGSLLFDVDFGTPLAVAVLVIAAVTAATSLMFIIARVCKTSEQAQIAQSIVAMVLGIAGGAFFPLAATGVLGTLLDLNPVAAFIRGLGITSGGGGLADLGAPLLVMVGFAVVMLGLSRVIPDRGAVL